MFKVGITLVGVMVLAGIIWLAYKWGEEAYKKSKAKKKKTK
jgi:hypothetical protein